MILIEDAEYENIELLEEDYCNIDCEISILNE